MDSYGRITFTLQLRIYYFDNFVAVILHFFLHSSSLYKILVNISEWLYFKNTDLETPEKELSLHYSKNKNLKSLT